SFSEIVQRDEDTHYNEVEDVVGSHVEDAVTFWAQQEKETTMNLTKHLESSLKTQVGTRMKNLATKVEILKEIRHVSITVRFGNDLSDAIKVLDEGCITTVASLNELEKIWAQYKLVQEEIQTCNNMSEGNILIAKRNEVQQKLDMAVQIFILEVDELPLNKRLKTLQDLSASLEAVYGQAKEGINSEEILRTFYDWKCDKREEFTSVRSETEASLQHLVAWFQNTLKVFDLSLGEPLAYEDTIGSIDEILENAESCVCKELEISQINSGGLLTMSLERDILDAEPMKELSRKRPLVRSEVNGQTVLLKEALKVMKGVAQGLHTLHKADIIHGSLHQNNVFALNREQGIVGDFDFTKSVSQRASVNMTVGGLSLTSPELKMGKPPSPSSDLYAYGCLLLWLFVQNQEFETNEDGIPKVDQFHLDDNVRSLLCSLMYFRSSLTAEQVSNAECFLLPKVKSIPNPEKEIEYSQYKKEDELKMENLDTYKEKPRNSEANID
ncbi:Serine/threonine-protein kinase 31, partial [Heterocephalus glaber]